MLFCGLSQIFIPLAILIEIKDKDLKLLVKTDVTLVRFICLSLLHFGFANDFALQIKLIKYLALHQKRFKYRVRALICCIMSITAMLLI